MERIYFNNHKNLVTKLCSTLVTPWTVAHQAHLSVGLHRQQYWNELPFHSLRDLPHPGINPGSPALLADSLLTEPELRRKKNGNNLFLSGNK